jgi:hypothetical protein
MRIRPDPLYVYYLALALARLPGRLEVDHDEANRILDDIAEQYERGDFAENEVLASYLGPPPGLRSLAEIKQDAEGRGEPSPSLGEIRVCGILSYAAAKRYVEASGLAGAPRVLREWFGAGSAVKPTLAELDAWMRENVAPGTKRDDAIRACRDATGATFREASAARTRLPDEWKLRRGQRARRGKIDN